MDEKLLVFFNQSLAHPALDLLMIGLTFGGLGLLPGIGVAMLVGRRRRVGLALLVALGVSLALTFVFQFLAQRPRPDANVVRLLWPAPNYPSFPSGHAALAFATAVVLGLSYRRKWVWLAAILGAGLISISRIYLGFHYPSDILGGAVLGASTGAACYGLLASPETGPSRWRWLVWPQAALVFLVTQMAYLDLLPGPLLRVPYMDKVLHFLLFGAVTFWLNFWLMGRAPSPKFIPLAVLLPLSLAALEEGAQTFSPLRTPDMTDFMADVTGMLFFWWISEGIFAPARPASCCGVASSR